MKVRNFPEKKLKVKEWKLFEVLPMDEDDDDFDESAEFCEAKSKRKRVRAPRKKRVYEEKESSSTAVAETCCPSSPELDTVRVYFDCHSFIDLDLFIPCTAVKSVRSVLRSLNGQVHYDNEFYRNEMRCSWWGKMTISKEQRKFGKNGTQSIPVLSFEYSVAKWWHYASAVNSGELPRAELLLLPCIQAMQVLHIEKYSSVSFKRIAQLFLERAELRRFDLSLNFEVPMMYSPDDYIAVLSRCMLNRQTAERHAEGSISYGTEKSPYRTIFYNKEKEAEKYYLTRDNTPKQVYFEDPKTHKTYEFQSKDGKRIEKVFDVNKEKRIFYENNKDLFRNKLRFEVQFRPKFMQEHNLEVTGMDNIDNVIRLGKFYWHEILDQFDEQLSRTNFEYKESDKEPIANALAMIEERRDNGVYSRTKANNMIMFVKDCYCKGWKVVRDSIGSNLFCQYSKWVKNEVNYDVRVALPDSLPIMRIMDTLLVSREGRIISQFRFSPSPIQSCVV